MQRRPNVFDFFLNIYASSWNIYASTLETIYASSENIVHATSENMSSDPAEMFSQLV